MRISDWSSDVCSSDLERRDGLQGGDVVPGCLRLLDTGEVRVDDLGVALQAEDQRDVDGDARTDHLGDRRQAGLRGRDLDQHVGPVHARGERSEEHTSELQSLMRISYAVFCLKKKNTLT